MNWKQWLKENTAPWPIKRKLEYIQQFCPSVSYKDVLENLPYSNSLSYNRLETPEFFEQTLCDPEGNYVQVFNSNGKLYYFRANIYP